MGGGRWKGDIVVMRIGKRNPLRPVDMRGKDARRVDYVVKRYVRYPEETSAFV